jgi:hypothetical protein
MNISELVAQHGYPVKIWDPITPNNPFVVLGPGETPNTFECDMPWLPGFEHFIHNDTKNVYELWED